MNLESWICGLYKRMRRTTNVLCPLSEEAPDRGDAEIALLICVAELLSGVCMTAKIRDLRFVEPHLTLPRATEGGAERVSGAPVLCRYALHALLQH